MDEEMNVGEILKETAEENQTRKILEILNESKDLAEAKEKVKALLNKQQGFRETEGRWTCQSRPYLQIDYTPFGKRKEEGNRCRK